MSKETMTRREKIITGVAGVFLAGTALAACGGEQTDAAPKPTETTATQVAPTEAPPCAVTGLETVPSDSQACLTQLTPEQAKYAADGGDLTQLAAINESSFLIDNIGEGMFKDYKTPDKIRDVNQAGKIFNDEVVKSMNLALNGLAQTIEEPRARDELIKQFNDHVTVDYATFKKDALLEKLTEIAEKYGANSSFNVLPTTTDGSLDATQFNKLTLPETGFGKTLENSAHIVDGGIKIEATSFELTEAGIESTKNIVDIPLSNEQSFVILGEQTPPYLRKSGIDQATRVGLSSEGEGAPYLRSNS